MMLLSLIYIPQAPPPPSLLRPNQTPGKEGHNEWNSEIKSP